MAIQNGLAIDIGRLRLHVAGHLWAIKVSGRSGLAK